MNSDTSADPSREPCPVFVVEDDLLVRRALDRLLRTAGYRVTAFESIHDFLEEAQPAVPSCILLDLHFPDGSGFDVLDALGCQDNALCAIVLTGHGDVPSAVKAMRMGALEMLEKPFDNKTVLAAVKNAILVAKRRGELLAGRKDILVRYERLSPRQQQVFELVAAGHPNKVIARELSITEKTVKAHRSEVMSRLNCGSLAELVRIHAVVATAISQNRYDDNAFPLAEEEHSKLFPSSAAWPAMVP